MVDSDAVCISWKNSVSQSGNLLIQSSHVSVDSGGGMIGAGFVLGHRGLDISWFSDHWMMSVGTMYWKLLFLLEFRNGDSW